MHSANSVIASKRLLSTTGPTQVPNVDRSVLALRIVSRCTNEKPGRLNREVIKLNVLPLPGEGTCLMLFSTRRHANLVSPTRGPRDGSETRGASTRGKDEGEKISVDFSIEPIWARECVVSPISPAPGNRL